MFIEFVIVEQALHMLSHIILTTALIGMCYNSVHFTHKETKMQQVHKVPRLTDGEHGAQIHNSLTPGTTYTTFLGTKELPLTEEGYPT